MTNAEPTASNAAPPPPGAHGQTSSSPPLACATDDVHASRAPEVTRVLRPGEARVSRPIDHTIGSRPRRWPVRERATDSGQRAGVRGRFDVWHRLLWRERGPRRRRWLGPGAKSSVPSVRYLRLNEARRRVGAPRPRPGGFGPETLFRAKTHRKPRETAGNRCSPGLGKSLQITPIEVGTVPD
jgi:hypothetical protein